MWQLRFAWQSPETPGAPRPQPSGTAAPRQSGHPLPRLPQVRSTVLLQALCSPQHDRASTFLPAPPEGPQDSCHEPAGRDLDTVLPPRSKPGRARSCRRAATHLPTAQRSTAPGSARLARPHSTWRPAAPPAEGGHLWLPRSSSSSSCPASAASAARCLLVRLLCRGGASASQSAAMPPSPRLRALRIRQQLPWQQLGAKAGVDVNRAGAGARGRSRVWKWGAGWGRCTPKEMGEPEKCLKIMLQSKTYGGNKR